MLATPRTKTVPISRSFHVVESASRHDVPLLFHFLVTKQVFPERNRVGEHRHLSLVPFFFAAGHACSANACEPVTTVSKHRRFTAAVRYPHNRLKIVLKGPTTEGDNTCSQEDVLYVIFFAARPQRRPSQALFSIRKPALQ